MNRRQLFLSTTAVLTVGISGCLTDADTPQEPHCNGTAPPTIFNEDNQRYDIDVLIEKDGETVLSEEYSVDQSNGDNDQIQIDVELEAETTYSVTISLSGTEYEPQQIEVPNGGGLAITIEDREPTVDTYAACD
ncbi:hypothetical protein PM076_15560 [Halorubrum ezzemoulense]|jgi:hypothetical protein|uniref:Uncharacterized protein n=1 Tax=Halorubrum ezzemoulense TaxID=337243 RepID=A0ABT4Z7W0_HALEZ|nr:hypothetical protein [Halorubrum ezzemoulense]MDB2242608.1 hypothetical protein [Halorubrum ezzemoulense]MDB2246073.1 hypothetical protein [Halorubrum ezzemoulense]MDB2279721.1 hypothetical protein [Halorubrum ezzemoulense]MDB2290146.1 hypothetical protein [Halorubrum ezzemoulense]MDB2294244.1 hypothetical protein [Halorubrum ezzemoulense]